MKKNPYMPKRYLKLLNEAEEMNDMFKAEGSSDRAIVLQSNPKDKRTMKIVILRYTPKGAK